jgi:beta-lactamase regulating signal transducer with metallopeptidase domain
MNALELFFDWLLAASLRASMLTGVVLIIRTMLRHRIPARWRYALWLPVLIVLLMPVFPESQWSMSSIMRAAPAAVPEAPVIERMTLPPAAPNNPATELPTPANWRQVVFFAWLAGAAGMLLFGLIGFAQGLWRFKRTRLPVGAALVGELALLVRQMGLHRAPRVWLSPLIQSPAVTGLLRPILLLPAHFQETLTPEETALVLKHELTHIKRGDLVINALLCVLLALHWFNPLLWLAFFKARLDRESACDAQVLASGSQTQRVAYGHTLLKIETSFSHHGLSLGFVGIFQRGAALRSRIQSIASQPCTHPVMKTALVLGIALLTFLGITRAGPPDANGPQILIDARFVEVSDGASVLPAPFDVAAKTSGVTGILNAGQMAAILQQLDQAKGVDVLATPRVTTRSGQEAKIKIVREFVNPAGAGYTPAKEVGVTLSALATVTGADVIDVDLTPQIVEFDGFVKDKGGVQQPIFSERQLKASVTMTSGQTLVIEMAPRTDKQTSEEREAGRVTVKSLSVTRRTLLFAAAHLIDPATGKPRVMKNAVPASPLQAKLKALILPSVQFANATVEEAVTFLRARSRDLDTATADASLKGVNIIFKTTASAPAARISLDLKMMPLGEVLKYVARLANLQLVVETHAAVLMSRAEFEAQQKRDMGRAAAEPAAPASSTEAFARKHILPQVQFREATLTEAIEFLRVKSRNLDPAGQGLNLVVNPGGDPQLKITLDLKNVPVFEALRYIAELSGHTLSADDHSIILTPR